MDVMRADHPVAALQRWAEKHLLAEMTAVVAYARAQDELRRLAADLKALREAHGKKASGRRDWQHTAAVMRALESIERPETPALDLLFNELSK